MVDKEQILDELRRVAAELGRTPGKRAFEIEAGIRESDWIGRYWVRWNEVVAAAGLTEGADAELHGLGYTRLDEWTEAADGWRCTVEPHA